MKTRTTRLTLSHSEGVFEVEIIDEGAGEYVLVSCGWDRPPFEQSISIGPSEWPFLRDAIDRMFVEIAEAQVPPESKAPQGAEAGWIPWEGGESAPAEAEFKQVSVRLRDGLVPAQPRVGWTWDWTHYGGENDIIAYKVVD